MTVRPVEEKNKVKRMVKKNYKMSSVITLAWTAKSQTVNTSAFMQEQARW